MIPITNKQLRKVLREKNEEIERLSDQVKKLKMKDFLSQAVLDIDKINSCLNVYVCPFCCQDIKFKGEEGYLDLLRHLVKCYEDFKGEV
jgi:hypothetical protein